MLEGETVASQKLVAVAEEEVGAEARGVLKTWEKMRRGKESITAGEVSDLLEPLADALARLDALNLAEYELGRKRHTREAKDKLNAQTGKRARVREPSPAAVAGKDKLERIGEGLAAVQASGGEMSNAKPETIGEALTSNEVVLRDALRKAGKEVPLEEVKGWSIDARKQARAWAERVNTSPKSVGDTFDWSTSPMPGFLVKYPKPGK